MASASALFTLKKSAVVDINKGNLDKAVEKLQKLVRIAESKKSGGDSLATVPLWSLLSEAYKQKCNFPSAARVNQTILTIVPDSASARFQLIEIYRAMGQNENSVEEARKLEAAGNCPKELQPYLLLHYAHSLVLHARAATTFDDTLEILAECAPLLEQLLSLTLQSTLKHKIYAQFLESVQKLDAERWITVKERLKLEQFEINDRLGVVKKRLIALSQVLRANLNFADSWNDQAICLVEMHTLVGDDALLDKAESCYQRAITLPSSPQKRSSYYHNYSILFTKRLQLQRASHCLIRALQINQQNDHAWFALAVLCLRANDTERAISFFRTAQEMNPDWADVWTNVWAAQMTIVSQQDVS